MFEGLSHVLVVKWMNCSNAISDVLSGTLSAKQACIRKTNTRCKDEWIQYVTAVRHLFILPYTFPPHSNMAVTPGRWIEKYYFTRWLLIPSRHFKLLYYKSNKLNAFVWTFSSHRILLVVDCQNNKNNKECVITDILYSKTSGNKTIHNASTETTC